MTTETHHISTSTDIAKMAHSPHSLFPSQNAHTTTTCIFPHRPSHTHHPHPLPTPDLVPPLNHPPQLSPQLQVLLERGQRQSLILLQSSEHSSPLQEAISLLLVQLFCSSGLVPRWPTNQIPHKSHSNKNTFGKGRGRVGVAFYLLGILRRCVFSF